MDRVQAQSTTYRNLKGEKRMNELALLPSESQFSQMKEIAQMAIKSGLLPSAIRTPEAAMIIALKGFELGLPPMVAFSHINVIQGKPAMSAEIMLASIYKAHPKATIIIEERSETKCILKAARPGVDKLATFEWNLDRARKMELLNKDNWKKQPGTMMFWRCITEMKRAIFPEVLMGIDYTADELEDIKDVTPLAPRSVNAEVTEAIAQPKSIKNFAPQTPEEAKAMNADILDRRQSEQKQEEIVEAEIKGEPEVISQEPSREDLGKKIATLQKDLKWTGKVLLSAVDTWFSKKPNELTTEEMMSLVDKLESEKANGTK
jgi:hypothetical protein